MSACHPPRYAVIGHPVAHSRSPFIHTAFAAQVGGAIDYQRIDCGPAGFAAAVRAFAAAGAAGCNVTVPFKFEAIALAATCTERARLAGAANTLRFDAAGWLADNTDGCGLLRDIQTNAGFALAGRRVLLVGAGGAAAGVLGPLLLARPRELVLVNRSAARAQTLARAHEAVARSTGVPLLTRPLDDPGAGFELIINASASSLHGAAAPVPATVLAPDALAVDLMYGPAAQGFLDWAAEHGARGRDGLGMLVEQAAEAFLLWRGVRPATAPVLQRLRLQVGAAP